MVNGAPRDSGGIAAVGPRRQVAAISLPLSPAQVAGASERRYGRQVSIGTERLPMKTIEIEHYGYAHGAPVMRDPTANIPAS